MSQILIHLRVVGSLMIREMNTRYGNKAGGYIWALVDPVAYIALLSFLRQSLSSMPPLGNSIALFMATGYLAYLFYASISPYVSSSIQANRALLNYPRVAPIDAVFSRLILQFITTAVIVAITIVMIAIGFADVSSISLETLVEAALATSMFGLGIGMINIVLYMRWPWYENIFSIVNRPLFLLSGVFLLPDELPHPFADYLLWNPLVHGVMWFRMGFYPEYRADLLDRSYLVESAFVSLFLGMLLFTSHRASIRNAQ